MQLLVGLMIAAAAGCGSDEPTDAHIRAAFERHRGIFDELRLPFEEDAKGHRLLMVSAASPNESRCGDRRTGVRCPDAERWREYSSKMQASGIRQIELHQETPGIYFHIYRNTFWSGGFRFRGLVYAPGSQTVTHDHDDAEERVDVGNGWYAFLIIDTLKPNSMHTIAIPAPAMPAT